LNSITTLFYALWMEWEYTTYKYIRRPTSTIIYKTLLRAHRFCHARSSSYCHKRWRQRRWRLPAVCRHADYRPINSFRKCTNNRAISPQAVSERTGRVYHRECRHHHPAALLHLVLSFSLSRPPHSPYCTRSKTDRLVAPRIVRSQHDNNIVAVINYSQTIVGVAANNIPALNVQRFANQVPGPIGDDDLFGNPFIGTHSADWPTYRRSAPGSRLESAPRFIDVGQWLSVGLSVRPRRVRVYSVYRCNRSISYKIHTERLIMRLLAPYIIKLWITEICHLIIYA